MLPFGLEYSAPFRCTETIRGDGLKYKASSMLLEQRGLFSMQNFR